MDQSQLSNLENLCKVLYESSNTSERNHAQQAILVLQSSSDYITQCQYILDHSKCSYALLVGSNSLSKLISTYWNNFDSPQRVQIRNYVLNYLANNGPGLEKYVSVAIIQLLCKITKLGWFDGSTHREITGEVSKFLSATVEHCVIGLQILNELVTQMNTPLGDQTLTVHRKIAVSFREQSLFRAMEIAFSTLSTIHLHQMAGASVETENSIAELSLQLAIKCLSFDFIGTNPDESAEEMGALQVPSAWRPLIQDPATMTLLFDVYGAMPPAIGARTLESLMLLACVRRSLFSPDKERTRFLGQLIKGITIILSNQTGLADHQNYHEFCRLLGRLKSNYQLTELIYTDGYKEWMDLVADFTVKSLQQWQWSANSVTYLLSLWARMVAAVPYVRADPSGKNGPMLDVYIPQVIRAYIHSRIEAVEQCSIDESMENLLDDIGNVMEQLDKLPIICHFQYRSLGDFMLSIFDPLISQYAEAIEAAGRNSMSSNNISPQCQVAMVEKKLAWLIYIVGAVLGGHSTTTAQGDDGDELVDGDLSQRVFRVMQMAENRLIESGGNLMSDMHLELSLLHYFHNFRRTYIGEQHGMPSTTSSPPLNTKSLSAKHQAYLRMFERLGHGSHTLVVNQIITKVGNNLKFWGNSGEVIEKTLDLFMEIASGYSSGKLLLGLETVHYLLGNHTDEEFPFLAIPANTRHRTTFHAILARLLFTAFDDASERHENFMAPIVSVLSRLMQASSYRQAEVKQAVIGICRDLRGITVSTHNRRTYGSLFELLHPDYFPVFVRAADECFDDPSVINALLKFMYEFSYNKAQRVIFDQSSPSGILLFREISQIIVAYGTKILPIPAGDDPYPKKYKGITLCLGILARALSTYFLIFLNVTFLTLM